MVRGGGGGGKNAERNPKTAAARPKLKARPLWSITNKEKGGVSKILRWLFLYNPEDFNPRGKGGTETGKSQIRKPEPSCAKSQMRSKDEKGEIAKRTTTRKKKMSVFGKVYRGGKHPNGGLEQAACQKKIESNKNKKQKHEGRITST